MKAKLYIEYNGRTYRVGGSNRCSSRRDCDLYDRDICNDPDKWRQLPCNPLNDALVNATGCSSKFCFKEVKK